VHRELLRISEYESPLSAATLDKYCSPDVSFSRELLVLVKTGIIKQHNHSAKSSSYGLYRVMRRLHRRAQISFDPS
jgi:hypothetical protein